MQPQQIQPLKPPTMAHHLARQIIAERVKVSEKQANLAMEFADGDGSTGGEKRYRAMSSDLEYDWGATVFELCKQYLGGQDERIRELEKLLTEQAMLRPPAPIVVERPAATLEPERQQFGKPVLAVCCGVVIGLLASALLVCILRGLGV